MSATVNRYLDAITVPKRRGRPIAKATLEQRLSAARAQFERGVGVEKLLAAQQVRDLEARLARPATAIEADIKPLEAAFVKIARKFSENRGVTYGTWRDIGVPIEVLQKAGIKRTRNRLQS